MSKKERCGDMVCGGGRLGGISIAVRSPKKSRARTAVVAVLTVGDAVEV